MWAGHGEGGHGCDFHGGSTSLRSIVSDLGGNMAQCAAPTLLGLLVGGVWQWQIQPSLSYGVPNPVQASLLLMLLCSPLMHHFLTPHPFGLWKEYALGVALLGGFFSFVWMSGFEGLFVGVTLRLSSGYG